MNRKWFNPFGDDDEEEKPAPKPQAPPARTAGRQTELAAQIREYLLTLLENENPHAFSKRTGYPKSSLNHILMGTGLQVHSLERLAETLGWSVTITDKQGKPVAAR